MSNQYPQTNKLDIQHKPERRSIRFVPEEERSIRIVSEDEQLTSPTHGNPAESHEIKLSEQIQTESQRIADMTALLQNMREECAALEQTQNELDAVILARQADVTAKEREILALNAQLEEKIASEARTKQLLKASDEESRKALFALFRRHQHLIASYEITSSDLSQDLLQLDEMRNSEFVNQSLLAPLEKRYLDLKKHLSDLQQELTRLSHGAALEAEQRSTELNTRKRSAEEV